MNPTANLVAALLAMSAIDLFKFSKAINADVGNLMAWLEKETAKTPTSYADYVLVLWSVPVDRKIFLIKLFRQTTGTSLKEAKDCIDRLFSGETKYLIMASGSWDSMNALCAELKQLAQTCYLPFNADISVRMKSVL